MIAVATLEDVPCKPPAFVTQCALWRLGLMPRLHQPAFLRPVTTMRVPLLTALAVMTMDCSAASGCGPTEAVRCAADRAAASALAGTWTQLQPANGVSVRMTLSARDTILTGTGTFTAAGGAGGTTQVAGFVFWRDPVSSPNGIMPAEPSTILDFTFQNGVAARFDQAKLFGRDTLAGVLTFSSNASASYGVVFVRAPSQ